MGTGEGRGKKRNSRETEDRLCPAELIEISKKSDCFIKEDDCFIKEFNSVIETTIANCL